MRGLPLLKIIEPPRLAAQPLTATPLYPTRSATYDAVWKSKTASHLFVNLDPASVARLTLACGSEDRVSTALGTLIRLRHIRVSTQHSDARHKAVTEFGEVGLQLPPGSWDEAWTRIAVMARGALNVLREEVHVGLP